MSTVISSRSDAFVSRLASQWKQYSFLRLPIYLLSFSALYFLAAKVGLAIQLPPNGIVTLWPANAVVLLSLLLIPRGKWWLFFIATVSTELVADVPAGYPVWAATGYGIVNFSEAGLAAFLLLRLNKYPPHLITLRDFLTFLAIGPLLASASAALLGAAIYKISAPEVGYINYWRVFWFGDALGLLTLGTVLLSLRRPQIWRTHPGSHMVLEGTALALGLVFSAYFAFFTVSPAPRILPAEGCMCRFAAGRSRPDALWFRRDGAVALPHPSQRQ